MVGTRIPTPSAEDKSSTVNQTQRDHASTLQGKQDQSLPDGQLYQSEDLEGKGVLYCELDSENNFPIRSEDGEGEKIPVDPSIQCNYQ